MLFNDFYYPTDTVINANEESYRQNNNFLQLSPDDDNYFSFYSSSCHSFYIRKCARWVCYLVRINFKGITNILCDFYYAIDITAVYIAQRKKKR